MKAAAAVAGWLAALAGALIALAAFASGRFGAALEAALWLVGVALLCAVVYGVCDVAENVRRIADGAGAGKAPAGKALPKTEEERLAALGQI